ncbi:hypothetical protein OIT44_02480 [Weissella ceti]|uniref:Uncharacterized protein n=1 Tax=Weissella ceti TaxID=759620 RepID=A0ABT3E3Z6_9LACO|nr:hypothetical protein [Weissella ceti]MCW0952937.1 hypothetical protein [Weissella ceti]QVK11483.1 hypothetical protein KHQ31_04490 [Weissella ceti]
MLKNSLIATVSVVIGILVGIGSMYLYMDNPVNTGKSAIIQNGKYTVKGSNWASAVFKDGVVTITNNDNKNVTYTVFEGKQKDKTVAIFQNNKQNIGYVYDVQKKDDTLTFKDMTQQKDKQKKFVFTKAH